MRQQTRADKSRQEKTRPWFEHLEDRRVLSVTVTSLLDDGSAGTLRERVAEVQDGTVSDNTIIFDSSLSDGTILLSYALELEHTIIIDASAAPGLRVDVSGPNSVFEVIADDLQIEMQDFTITGGESVGNGGAIDVHGARNNIDLTLQNMEISGNSAVIDGGGISFGAKDSGIKITDSVIANNHSGNHGGGIAIDSFSVTLDLARTEVISNSTNAFGGGVYFKGIDSSIEIIDSLIADNKVGDSQATDDFGRDGAGIHVLIRRVDGITNPAVLISGSTISLNENFGDSLSDESSLSHGGGASLQVRNADIDIIQSTITGNVADHGGGLYANVWKDAAETPEIRIVDSTVSGNTARDDGGGALICAKVEGSAKLVNSTVSGNQAGADGTGKGGGLYFAVYYDHESLDAVITNSTITANTAPDVASGGGVFLEDLPGVVVEANNSVISLNLTSYFPQVHSELSGQFLAA